MSSLLRKMVVSLMVLLLAFNLPTISFAMESKSEWEDESQEESRAIDGPSYDYFPGDGGAGLLFTMVAEEVPTRLYSDNMDQNKRFRLSDLPSAATNLRFYGQLFHSKEAEGATFYYEPIECGVCYFNPGTGYYTKVKTQETYSGETIDTTFPISEYITNDSVYYYGFISNSFGFSIFIFLIIIPDKEYVVKIFSFSSYVMMVGKGFELR